MAGGRVPYLHLGTVCPDKMATTSTHHHVLSAVAGSSQTVLSWIVDKAGLAMKSKTMLNLKTGLLGLSATSKSSPLST